MSIGGALDPGLAHLFPAKQLALETERDEQRLRSIVDRDCAFVWRTLRRFGVSEEAADDATQRVFLALANRIQEVRAESERAFLVGICMRVAANQRRRALRNREEASPSMDQQIDPAQDPEHLLQWKQRRELLDSALEQLPEEQRVVFVLFELEGMSMPEVAESLSIPLGTASSRLRRARARFEAWVKRQQLRQRP